MANVRVRFVRLLLIILVCGMVGLTQTGSPSATETKGASSPVTVPSAQDSGAAANALREADSLFREGKYKAAVERYQAALRETPPQVAAYAGLSRSYLKQQNLAMAHEAAQKGVDTSPDASFMRSALGDVYFREGKIAEAEAEYAKAQQLNNSNARAWFGRSRVYTAVSMYRHAHEYLIKAHELDPTDRDIQMRWFRTLRPSEQIAELQKYLAAPAGEDRDEREANERRLELLKIRQNQPARACRLMKPIEKTETNLEPLMYDPRQMRGWGLKVGLNGNTSRLLIDTGASGIVINRRAAEKAGITRVMATNIRGLGDAGPTSGYIGYADSIKIGDLEFSNCLVEVSDKRSIVDDDGLIGADVFSAFLVTLDFPDRRLKLEPLPQPPDEKPQGTPELKSEGDAQSPSEKPEATKESQTEASKPPLDSSLRDRYIAPEMQSYTRIFRFGHDLLIPTKIGNAPPKLFLIDTGAFSNLMSPDAAREVTKVRNDTQTMVRGLSGKVKDVSRADKVTILFSHYRQENQNILTLDLSGISRSAGTEVSGVLGFNMLRLMEMKIDYRDGLVDFFYDPHRFH